MKTRVINAGRTPTQTVSIGRPIDIRLVKDGDSEEKTSDVARSECRRGDDRSRSGATILDDRGDSPPFARADERTAYHQSATDPVRAETSQACLECHDGSIGENILGNRPDLQHSNHPIGIGHLSRLAESQGGLKPIGSTLRLEAGTVGCVTCHDLASYLPAKLAMSNDGSALCLTCHNL